MTDKAEYAIDSGGEESEDSDRQQVLLMSDRVKDLHFTHDRNGIWAGSDFALFLSMLLMDRAGLVYLFFRREVAHDMLFCVSFTYVLPRGCFSYALFAFLLRTFLFLCAAIL